MIKCNQGKTTIRGTTLDIVAELATVIHGIKQVITEAGMKAAEADNLLKKAFEVGIKTDEELKASVAKALQDKIEENEKEIEETKRKIIETINEIMDILKKEGD